MVKDGLDAFSMQLESGWLVPEDLRGRLQEQGCVTVCPVQDALAQFTKR